MPINMSILFSEVSEKSHYPSLRGVTCLPAGRSRHGNLLFINEIASHSLAMTNRNRLFQSSLPGRKRLKSRDRIYFFSHKSIRTSVLLVLKSSPIRTGGTPATPVLEISISVFERKQNYCCKYFVGIR